MIFIAHKNCKEKTLIAKYGECTIVDVTSKATGEIRKLSPFYPHGGIPIPNSNIKSESVEGIWQGLKIFEKVGIDYGSFGNKAGKNIKRTVRKFGIPAGHQYGINSKELLSYIDARIKIYLPAYKYVLENYCGHIITRLKEASKNKTIILLDYTTNGNVYDTSTPLSHAQLVKHYVLNEYDQLSDIASDISEKVDANSTVTENERGILELIEDNPLSSNEIVKILNLDISARKLTYQLKKSHVVHVIPGKPLKFKLLSNELKLFK